MDRTEYLATYRLTHKKELQDYRKTHKDQIRDNNRRWRANHKDELKIKNHDRYLNEKESRKEYSKIQYRKRKEKITREVFLHYGYDKIECCRCGFNNIFALTLDHINGGGHKHRESLRRTGMVFYCWLQKQGYPEGYQLMCMNCQFIKFKT